MNVVEWVKERARALILRRQLAYQRKFLTACQDTDVVLRDIAKFCRAGKTVFHADPRIHAVLTGRQEVWLRIEQNLHASPERLYELYGGPKDE